MPNVGPLELAIVLIIALIVFGPKRLPELGRSLGRGIREFRGSVSGDRDESDSGSPDRGSGREEIEAPAPSSERADDGEPVAHDRN